MLKELRYRFRHEHCWLQETTERFPSLTLVVSNIYEVDEEIHVDLTVHGPDAATIRRAEEWWREDKRIRKVSRLYEGPRGIRFHVSYAGTHSIYRYILRHTPVSLGAISIAAGVEHYSVVGEAEDVQGLVAVLAEKGHVTVDSVKSLTEVPFEPDHAAPESLASALTDRQLEAILVAFAAGYYKWPRTISASALAERLDVSSSAFLAHLRQGESKLLEMAVRRLLDEDPGRLEAAEARLAVKQGP